MSDGSSWSRAQSLPFGQDGAAQQHNANMNRQTSGFGTPAFGTPAFGAPVPAGPQLQNPFQQPRHQAQSQNWFAPTAANGGAFNAQPSWPSNGSGNAAYSAFSTHQNQQFVANSGSAFANAAAAQPPFPASSRSDGSRFNAQGSQQQPFLGQDQKQPQSAFTSVLSSAAPANAPVSIQPRDKTVKAGQRTQSTKRQGRKDHNEPLAKSQAGSETSSQSHKGPKDRQTPTRFPQFAPTQFPVRSHARSNDNAILKPLPTPLTVIEERKDPWDQENQRQLELIEQEYLNGRRSLQEAYDLMNSMRDKERKEMEKRGLVDNAQVRKSLDDAIAFVGSCTDMCPVYERVRRALENNALGLEKDAHGKVIASRAVKAFARPAAGNPPALPSDVRPPSVLVNTLRYLVEAILPKLPDSHAFLWDRTRSIRQDFTFQNFQGPEATWCLEVIARIHITCLHTMARAASTGTEWSQQQELEQFNKCLQSLSEFYQQSPTDNEPEMRAYGLLSHLFDDELVAAVDRLPLQVSRHPLVLLALELRALATTSIAEFFIRIRKPDVPATFRAILEIHFNELRVRGVRNLTTSMHQRTNAYPFRRFALMLGFERDDQARQFCDFYDITLSSSEEAGEEIDVKAWSEENIRDKRPMAQAFDYSLDALINKIDVTKSLELGPGSGQPNESSFARLLDQQKPKFNVSAPSFKPSVLPTSNGNLQSGKNESTQSTASATQSRNVQKPSSPIKFDFRQPGLPESLQGISSSTPFNGQSLTSFPPGDQAKPPQAEPPIKAEPPVSAPHANTVGSRISPSTQPKPEPRRPPLPESTLVKVYEGAVLKETEKVLERARQITQREHFVDAVSRQIMNSLLCTVSAADSDMLLKAVDYDRHRLKKFAVRIIKRKAALAMQRKRESEQQQQELKMFWSRPSSRVVSHSRSRAAAPVVIQTPKASERIEEVGDVRPEIRSHEESDMTDEQIEPFSFLPVIPLMRKAYSSGFSNLAIVIDPVTKQGVWIQDVLGTGIITVEVLPGRVVKIHIVNSLTPGFDACLFGEGVARPSCNVSHDISGINTLIGLERAFSKILRDWLTWHENDLLHYRSLNVVNVKRRRVSRPSHGYQDSTPNTTADSLTMAQNSFAAQTNERARLRALVADARSLMK